MKPYINAFCFRKDGFRFEHQMNKLQYSAQFLKNHAEDQNTLMYMDRAFPSPQY